MSGILLILPLIIPLLTAIAGLFAGAIQPQNRKLQRVISFAGSLALFTASAFLLEYIWRNGIQALQAGSWPVPYGITLVADMFSAIMVLMAGVIGLSVQVFALASIDPERERFGFHPLYHVLLMGVSGAFLTGDLFNLYVWFEVLLMSSFVLMALGSGRGQTEGAIKYVTLNLISSAIFLAAIGILYGVVGTLNMADLSVKFAEIFRQPGSVSGLLNVIAVLFLVAFGIKAAIFPLFFWLPDSYHVPPPAVSAVFAGLLTKVGVYAMIRMFTLILPLNEGLLQGLLMWVAALTMVTGVLGAVAQNEIRRILSVHIISQIGYMVMGLALFTPLALAGAVYYIFHNVMVKTNLFLVGGLVERLGGTGELKKLGGLYRSMPLVSVLFLIPALSLAGLPPLSGFFAKLSLIQAGFDAGQFWLVAVALVVSMLTLYSMTKIWTLAFWQPGEIEKPAFSRADWMVWLAPLFALTVVSLVIGLGAGIAFPLALRAGNELMDPSMYITAVFGSGQ